MKNSGFCIHPATLYLILLTAIILFSWILDVYSVYYVSPDTGELVYVRSLLSPGGIRWLLRHFVSNFTGFAPLGMVVVAMSGLGIAYYSGFLQACIYRFVNGPKASNKILWGIIFAGILSNVIGDTGYIVLMPLAALLCGRVGIHPLVGVVVAFVSVACGYNANLFVSTMDPMMSRLTDEVTEFFNLSNQGVGPLCNWIFMAVSTVLVAVVIYWVTIKWLVRKFETYPDLQEIFLGRKEKRALYWALGIGLLYVFLVLFATFSSYGILRGVSGNLMRSSFIFGILFLLSLGFGLMGLIYGIIIGRFKSDRSVVDTVVQSMHFLSPYIVIVFMASQMFACFEYSNLDKWIVTTLSAIAIGWNVPVIGKLVLFILVVSAANFFMVSATGKWAIMSYIFIPYFAEVGLSPEMVQCAFRIGDSLTNAITPFMFYMPLLYVYMQKYHVTVSYWSVCRYTGIYTFFLSFIWILFFFLWYLCGLPVGI